MGFTAAVVGHGTSALGKGWGKKIDACDLVVRMWNCHWQNEADYGTKYDYGLIEASPGLITAAMQHKRRDPAEGFIASKLFRFDRIQLPPRSELADQAPWVETAKEMGGLGATGRLQFTRGTVAACWLIDRAYPGDTIVLVAFDDIYGGITVKDAFPKEYLVTPGICPTGGYKPGLRKYGNHDYAIERPLMERLAKDRGARVVFSQEVWA